MLYADTSFLASLYLLDANTHHAQSCLPQEGALFLTPFGQLELSNAIRLALFRGQINPSQQQAAEKLIEKDLQSGWLSLVAVGWSDVLVQAESLSSDYTARIGCRTLDILHVALAKILSVDGFLTFDNRQAELARKAKLKVIP